MIPLVRDALRWGERVRTRGVDAVVGLAEREDHLAVKSLFRVIFLAWIGFSTLVLLPRHEEFWGTDAFVVRSFDPSTPTDWIVRLINHPGLEGFHLAFVFVQLTAVALALAGWRIRAMVAVALVMTLNLYHRCFMISDGGNNLSWLLLSLMLFMNTSGRPMSSPFGTAISNVVFRVARVQVVLMYATAGLCKVVGTHWQSGMALYYILQVDNYANPLVAPLLVELWPLTVIGTYATIAFQLGFVFLIWMPRFRWLLFTAGLFLHLNIALVMGLPAFGAIMCISYVLFFTEETASGIARWFVPEPGTAAVSFDPNSRFGSLFAWLCHQTDAGYRLQPSPAIHDGPALRIAARPELTSLQAASYVVARTPFRWARPILTAAYYLGADRMFERTGRAAIVE